MPTTNGLIHRSPAANPQVMTRSAQNGRISAWGCHASKSSSLPIAHARPADRAVTRTRALIAAGPLRGPGRADDGGDVGDHDPDSEADTRAADAHEGGEHVEPEAGRGC